MNPQDPPAGTIGSDPFDAAGELARLRAVCRRQGDVIDGLGRRCTNLRQRAAVLQCENERLRVALADAAWREAPVAARPAAEADGNALAAGPRAPGAARALVDQRLRGHAPARVVADAQLVVSELVTNSLEHADVSPDDLLRVSIELAHGSVRLEVEDPGSRGVIAPRGPDLVTGGGFGLNVVVGLAARWGVIRDGTTRVWAELTWPPTPHSSAAREGERTMSGLPIADRADVQPVAHEGRDRVITGTVTILPLLALGVAVWRTWHGLLRPGDVLVFAVLYVLTGLGVTVGFHRHFTHRSFKTPRAVRVVLAVLGSAAVEGGVISWVANHRRHHAFSDRPGDPHSPHVDHGGGWTGALRGLAHAHLGWLFTHEQRGAYARYAPDLLADPAIRLVDRTFPVWAIGGLAAAFGLGVAIGGTVAAGLTALLWGGLVRLFVLHHLTYSINSICHAFGRRRFATDDQSRNVFWLALPTLGEAWHNNHHAFPTSASHGLGRWELDPSAAVIRALEVCGLAWDVVRIAPERQARKAIDAEPIAP